MTKIDKKGKKIVAIICARGGSKGIPKKNIYPFLGKPLIYYTLKSAKDSKYIDRIIVATDDKEIAKVAKENGAEVPFLRPTEISGDTNSAEEVLNYTLDWLEKEEDYKPDIIVYLQITDIFKQKHFVDQLIEWLLQDETLDSAFVGYPSHKKFWTNKEGKFVRVSKPNYITRQKTNEFTIREDTGLGCATRSIVIKKGIRVGENVKILLNHDENSSIDIHDKEDIWLAEQIFLREKKKNPEKYVY